MNSTLTPALLKKRLEDVRPQLKGAHLVAVTKNSPWEHIDWAFQSGVCDFGENRVEVLKEKAEKAHSLGLTFRWHMIGQLQSKKIKLLLQVPGLFAIHSMTSLELLKKLALQFKGQEKKGPLHFFLQVNISGEKEKGGTTSFSQLCEICDWWKVHEKEYPGLNFLGLMGMGPIRTTDFKEETCKAFDELQKIAVQLKATYREWPFELSMGMSSDYLWAVDRGSSWVRLGQTLFSNEFSK